MSGTGSWIVRLDANGNIIWQNRFPGACSTASISEDNGSIILGGEIINNDNVDCIVVKMDLNGSIVWEKTYGGTGTDQINELINRY